MSLTSGLTPTHKRENVTILKKNTKTHTFCLIRYLHGDLKQGTGISVVV